MGTQALMNRLLGRDLHRTICTTARLRNLKEERRQQKEFAGKRKQRDASFHLRIQKNITQYHKLKVN
jgi:hypothetical protein